MERVVVTGGAGFIGSHVVEELIAAGYFVYIVDNFRTGQEANLRGFKTGSFDVIRDCVRRIGEHETLRDVQAIFHLAAEVGNINSIEHTDQDAETNVLGTIAACEFARQRGAKIIYSSSSAIYGESAHLPIDEQHPTRPLSPYGLSKLTGELYVQMYGALHNVPYVCLRYFNVYGEGQLYNPYSNVIPIFVRRLLASESLVVYGDGKQTRDFVHVSDVARANVAAAKSTIKAGSYNVATGVSASLLDLVAILRKIAPPFAVEFQPARAGEVRHSVATVDEAKKAIGYESATPLTDGVKRFYEWTRTALGEERTLDL